MKYKSKELKCIEMAAMENELIRESINSFENFRKTCIKIAINWKCCNCNTQYFSIERKKKRLEHVIRKMLLSEGAFSRHATMEWLVFEIRPKLIEYFPKKRSKLHEYSGVH